MSSIQTSLDNLCTYTLHSNTSDYYCESYKFDDGRLIINQLCTATVDITQSTANIYWGQYTFPNYPISFTDYPLYITFAQTNGTNAWCWGANRSKSYASSYVARHNSYEGASLIMTCHAEGRWK